MVSRSYLEEKHFGECYSNGNFVADTKMLSLKILLHRFLSVPTTTCFHVSYDEFPFWIAGQRQDMNKPFYWKLPNHLEKPLNYTNWAPNEPDGSGGDDACIDVFNHSGFQWREDPCSIQICPLCEIL